MNFHDHICHRCGAVFTDDRWNCQLTDYEALCARCEREVEQGADE